MTRIRPISQIKSLVLVLLALSSCQRVPPLHLHREKHVDFLLPMVQLDLLVYWSYDLDYDWRTEWTYGWDDYDREFFGEIGYTEPSIFDLRRYYLADQPGSNHTTVDEFVVNGNRFKARYLFGYHDILVWNQIEDKGGAQSLVLDEVTTLDSIMAFTNMGITPSRYEAPVYDRAFYQPEELFAGYARDVYISDDIKDYDHYDEETATYYKQIDMELHPVTYIYLTQVRLHNNRGRIEGVDGEANMSGMARGVTLNTGIANRDAVTVHYNVRFKRDCIISQTGEHVDVAGGRCLTFGIPNQNSSRVTRVDEVKDRSRHYMDVNFLFNNGMDSTFVFDVTDQVRKRYKGGVITIDLDVDTIPLPSRAGGSGFDAVVKEFEEEQYEFEMGKD